MMGPLRIGELPLRRLPIFGGGARYSSGSDGGLGVGDGLGLGLGLGLCFKTPRTMLTLSPLSRPPFPVSSTGCFNSSLLGIGGGSRDGGSLFGSVIALGLISKLHPCCISVFSTILSVKVHPIRGPSTPTG